MPSLSALPSKLNREKLAKALERLGFIVSRKGGKGSHIKVTHERTQKSVTLPVKLNKNILYYVLKEIEKYSGVSWDDIKENL